MSLELIRNNGRKGLGLPTAATGVSAAVQRFLVVLSVLALLESAAVAQTSNPGTTAGSPPADEEQDTTVFNHPATSRYWVSGQINIILQWHPSFRAKYTGANSVRPEGENATSQVLTLYTGVQLTPRTELLADAEIAGGRGLSSALGIAGFPNLDVVRNPTLSKAPYLARLMVRHVIPLSQETVVAERGPLNLRTSLPARRLELRFGKFSLVDFFDLNSGGSDSHLQFMNWAVDNNAAYDYAANTRGYTWGAIVEFYAHGFAVRFAEALMPKIANGINLDANPSRARSENVEVEFRGKALLHRSGAVRLLGFVNHANMGSYREAINAFLAGQDSVPDITRHRRQGRIKYGFGANFEQELPKGVGLFGRFGWNEGHHESFAYTEAEQTIELGADLKGDAWRRRHDKIGAVVALNAISGDHRRYLALGGLGFLLGDGALRYGRERIFETYYTLHLWRGVFFSFDFQHITNPAYNRDRGPALVPAVRLHLDL